MPRTTKRPNVSRVRVPDPDKGDYKLELGSRIRVARKGAQLEPEEMAKKLGTSTNTYLKWERGERTFPMHLVTAFCTITKFSPNFIVTGKPTEEWSKTVETGKFRRPHFRNVPDDDDDD